METGSAVIIFIYLIGICYIIYNSIPSKYSKLDESFGGFMNRSLFKFEYEKSPLHTIVYDGTGTGKTYFIRQCLKLYLDPRSVHTDQNQNQNQDQHQNQDQDQGSNLVNHEQSSFTDQAKNIIIVCKDDRDWIDHETGEFYIGFNTCDINMITSKNKSKFKDSVIVLDDMGDKLNKDIAYYFTERRHYNMKMIVMCHKPAQINNTARMSSDTIYLRTYNGADLFKNFNEIYKCEHNFNKIISELNSNYYNCTDGMSDELRYGIIKYNRNENTFIIIDKNRTVIYDSRVGFLDLKALSLKDKLESEDKNELLSYMKPLMINATDRNTINHDNYQFYFNKLLISKCIKVQNDVVTQEMVKADGFRLASIILGIIGTCFMIYNYMSPDTTVETAGHVTTIASYILNRASTLVNFGCEEEEQRKQFIEKLQEEYINKETGILNEEGRMYLNRLYENNEKFREEIIIFVRDKTEFDLEVILDRRYNTLNTKGKKYLTECVASKDNTKDVIEILAKYNEYN